ncbi:basement membrane-specific heparan sulfate proteoglycan core protein-like [Phycodurus eques]|uniref:basement membrane-specific heparan sulfate proteoglycan core protein-like n=1 Tax=Phycodurus eques TaxID=693459 RepID=UPI002ACDCE83|nr:basement membrane-specific heparan sulfate proteoglycan core protein-like [Phycodurus eques]
MGEGTMFVRLLVGLLLIATGACCPIELNPSGVAVRYGDPVSINCSTSDPMYKGMGWEAPQGDTGLKLVHHLTWSVDALKAWNISPMCFLSPVLKSGRQQCSKKPNVVVYTFPQMIFIQANSSLVKEGESIQLKCVVGTIAPIQSVAVRWYNGQTVIMERHFKGSIKGPVDLVSDYDYQYNEASSRQQRLVKLKCEAVLDLTPEGPQLSVFSPEFHLTVKYDIEHVELTCPSKYTAVEYAVHNLSCSVEGGSPETPITWYKDGDEVELSETLTRYDAGQYVVVANSFSSTVNATVDLNVVYPPSQIEELEDVEVELGSEVCLKCSTRGNPRPEYSWSAPTLLNVAQVDEDGVSRLQIPNVTSHHTGVYTCHASNERGTVSKQVTVSVNECEPGWFRCPSGICITSYRKCNGEDDCGDGSDENFCGEHQECPIRIHPETLVLQYKGESQNATCTFTGSRNVQAIAWHVGQILHRNETWTPDTNKDWDSVPLCTAFFKGQRTCQKSLNFTLYKTPDSVTVRPVNNAIFLEGEQCRLHCDIINVAPAQSLIVRWYQGNQTIEPSLREPLRLADCPHDTNMSCDLGTTGTPVNVSASASFFLNRTHHEAALSCEAHLELGPAGPQLSPSVISRAISFSVYYKPVINTTKLPRVVPLFRGYPEELVCEADGQPPPIIYWSNFTKKTSWALGGNITVLEAGRYICMAVNQVATVVHEVDVVPKEDYLPLIAGFVAATVVVISAIFLFIYSIYYKNTKMRRYSLKNPKLDGHNANVAHNGWDLQFPMTKLSILILFSRKSVCFTAFMMMFILFGCLIAYAAKPASASCPLEIIPASVAVPFGGSVSAVCKSSSDQATGMGWESLYGGGGLVKGVSNLTLQIDSLKHWRVRPICFVNLNGSQCTKMLPVTVYKMADNVSISLNNSVGPIVEGKKYEVLCEVIQAAPMRRVSLDLLYGNKTLDTNSIDHVVNNEPVSILIVTTMLSKREYNGGQIRCAAKMDFGPSGPNLPAIYSEPLELIVQYPPTFSQPENENLTLPVGGVMSLNCSASGNPAPEYSWKIPYSSKVPTGTRAIFDSSFKHPGTYECTATNSEGAATKRFTVTEAPRTRTTLAAVLGVFVALAVVLCVLGLFFLTPQGTFSCSKPSYTPGHASCAHCKYTTERPTVRQRFGHSLRLMNNSSTPTCWLASWGPLCPTSIVPCRVCQACATWDFSYPGLLQREVNMANMASLQWIMAVCMFCSVSGDGCSLILKPARAVVGFGEPVSVSCEAARPVRVLGWESAISAAHTQQGPSVQWKVDSLIDWIEEPICYGVFFTAPRQCEEKLNLVLYKNPDSVTIKVVNHTGPMVAGKEYQLLCEVQNVAPVQYLNLKWYKERREVYNRSFIDLNSPSPVQVSSILLITPSEADDGAQYSCVAELELGPEGPQPPPNVTSEPLRASVYFPPTFQSPDAGSVDIAEGGETTLNCTAVGNPAPVYSWQPELEPRKEEGQEAVLASSSLLPGTYTCTASNALGKKTKQFTVKAKSKGRQGV